MISPPPDRVQVWASQLAASDFPPVCAMTGRPAETWRKFKFRTVPAWAEGMSGAVGVAALGLAQFHLLAPIIEEATMRRASGRLPLTKSSKRRLWLIRGVFLTLMPLGLAFLAAAPTINSFDRPNLDLVGILATLGLASLTIGVLGTLHIAPRFGPTGVVLGRPRGYQDNLIELRRVHPLFVEAVQNVRLQRAREAERAREEM